MLTSLHSFMAERERTLGPAAIATRKIKAESASKRMEMWLRSPEGIELECKDLPAHLNASEQAFEIRQRIDSAVSFYRFRIMQVALVLSERNVERLDHVDPLRLLVLIQDLIKNGKMI